MFGQNKPSASSNVENSLSDFQGREAFTTRVSVRSRSVTQFEVKVQGFCLSFFNLRDQTFADEQTCAEKRKRKEKTLPGSRQKPPAHPRLQVVHRAQLFGFLEKNSFQQPRDV